MRSEGDRHKLVTGTLPGILQGTGVSGGKMPAEDMRTGSAGGSCSGVHVLKAMCKEKPFSASEHCLNDIP